LTAASKVDAHGFGERYDRAGVMDDWQGETE